MNMEHWSNDEDREVLGEYSASIFSVSNYLFIHLLPSLPRKKKLNRSKTLIKKNILHGKQKTVTPQVIKIVVCIS